MCEFFDLRFLGPWNRKTPLIIPKAPPIFPPSPQHPHAPLRVPPLPAQ